MHTTKFLTLAAMLAFAGCAHNSMRGSVAMKVSDEEAHVCLGDNDVKAGDQVAFFKNVCIAPRSAGKLGDSSSPGSCRKERLGEGLVERTFNEHYSLVKVNPGVQFEEGTVVEKQ